METIIKAVLTIVFDKKDCKNCKNFHLEDSIYCSLCNRSQFLPKDEYIESLANKINGAMKSNGIRSENISNYDNR